MEKKVLFMFVLIVMFGILNAVSIGLDSLSQIQIPYEYLSVHVTDNTHFKYLNYDYQNPRIVFTSFSYDLSSQTFSESEVLFQQNNEDFVSPEFLNHRIIEKGPYTIVLFNLIPGSMENNQILVYVFNNHLFENCFSYAETSAIWNSNPLYNNVDITNDYKLLILSGNCLKKINLLTGEEEAQYSDSYFNLDEISYPQMAMKCLSNGNILLITDAIDGLTEYFRVLDGDLNLLDFTGMIGHFNNGFYVDFFNFEFAGNYLFFNQISSIGNSEICGICISETGIIETIFSTFSIFEENTMWSDYKTISEDKLAILIPYQISRLEWSDVNGRRLENRDFLQGFFTKIIKLQNHYALVVGLDPITSLLNIRGISDLDFETEEMIISCSPAIVLNDYSLIGHDVYLHTNGKLVKLVYSLSNAVVDEVAIDKTNFCVYPNPFNPSTTIRFESDKISECQVSIYNLKGQKIKNLYTGLSKSGANQFTWTGKDDHGKPVSSGIYFVRLNQNNKILTKKVMLMK